MGRRTRKASGVFQYIWMHPANRDHRVRSVARGLTFQIRGRLFGKPTLARLGERMTLIAELHSAGASKVVYANPPDFAEMSMWRALLRPHDLFCDVGSNVGVYSLWAADCGATPIAVEPDPKNAQRTRENLRRNGVQGEVYECALSDAPGTITVTSGADTLNHIVHGSSHDPQSVVTVQARTLDDILGERSVRGLKVDVEGFERLVLEGGCRALQEARIDVLQIEWNQTSLDHLGESRDGIRELLTSFGYVFAVPNDDNKLQRLSPVPPYSERDIFAVSPARTGDLLE